MAQRSEEDEVHKLSDRLLLSIPEAPPHVGLLALIDASVRVLKTAGGYNTATALRELARLVNKIARAEAGH